VLVIHREYHRPTMHNIIMELRGEKSFMKRASVKVEKNPSGNCSAGSHGMWMSVVPVERITVGKHFTWVVKKD